MSALDFTVSPPTAPEAADAAPQIKHIDRDCVRELEAFFVSLDHDTRCRRFGHAVNDEVLRAHARKLASETACLVGAYVNGALRGVLEIYGYGRARWAEVALVVESSARQRGLGWSMFQAALQWANTTGDRTLRLIFSPDNRPMRAFANKAKATIAFEPDEICADIPLPYVAA